MPSLFESASSTLSLSDSVASNVNLLVSASDFIPLQDAFPDVNFKFWATQNAVGLADSLEVTNFIFEAASNTVALTDTATASGGTFNFNEGHSLGLTQTAQSSIKAGIASNTLGLSQSVAFTSPVENSTFTNITTPIDEIPLGLAALAPEQIVQALSLIGLRDSVTVGGVFNKSIISYASFGQPAFPITEASASSHVQLLGVVELVEYEAVTQYVYFTHTATVDRVSFASHTVGLTDAATYDAVFSRATTTNINLTDQDGDGNAIRSSDAAAALPIRSTSSGCPHPTPFTRRSTILLTYPYPIFTHSVELRNPVFNDNQQLEFRRINRLTRGSTLKMFRDPAWPEAERLIYNFDNLKQEDIKNYLAFVQLSIGREIGLLDFESRQWRGFIITPDANGQEEDRPGFDLLIEFEGVEDTDASVADAGDLTEGLRADLRGTGAVGPSLTDIPPGFQAAISASSELVGNVLRD